MFMFGLIFVCSSTTSLNSSPMVNPISSQVISLYASTQTGSIETGYVLSYRNDTVINANINQSNSTCREIFESVVQSILVLGLSLS